MRLLALASSICLSVAGPAFAQEGGLMGPYPGVVKVAGPALLCGQAFALRLAAGEKVQKQEGVDFFLYYTDAADGPFLIYEGNAPQPHDDEIKTGSGFPAVIAIHDNRNADAKARSRVRDRLLTGGAFAEACPQQRSSE